MQKSTPLKKKIFNSKDLYVLLLPGLIWYLMFAYKPMAGLVTAFYDYNIFKGIHGSQFVGLANFRDFMGGPDFVRTLINTLMISLWQIAVCFPIPILLAICVVEMKNKFISKLTQTTTFLPYFISTVVVCSMVISFLSPSTGVVNLIIRKLGGEPQYFLVQPQYFRKIFTLMTLWQTGGFNAIVYIAALMGVDPQLYEAAIVDGAGKMKQIIHITIPGIIPTIVTMLILNLGKMVEIGYESIILLYNPSTFPTADVISTYSYRMGLVNGNYGIATAAGLFQAIIALLLVASTNRLSKRVSENGLW